MCVCSKYVNEKKPFSLELDCAMSPTVPEGSILWNESNNNHNNNKSNSNNRFLLILSESPLGRALLAVVVFIALIACEALYIKFQPTSSSRVPTSLLSGEVKVTVVLPVLVTNCN